MQSVFSLYFLRNLISSHFSMAFLSIYSFTKRRKNTQLWELLLLNSMFFLLDQSFFALIEEGIGTQTGYPGSANGIKCLPHPNLKGGSRDDSCKVAEADFKQFQELVGFHELTWAFKRNGLSIFLYLVITILVGTKGV